MQANLLGCQHMMITETGLFDGNATIDEAEVHGRFEGDLVVRNRLFIRATGRVSGTVSRNNSSGCIGGLAGAT